MEINRVEITYFRPAAARTCSLDAHVKALVARYLPLVHLEIIESDIGDAPRILVSRDGRWLGALLGYDIPARELDRIVYRAIASGAAPVEQLQAAMI